MYMWKLFFKVVLIINLMMIINFNNYFVFYIFGIDILVLNEKNNNLVYLFCVCEEIREYGIIYLMFF